MSAEVLLPLAFFCIALVYSSVGFAGGSSYLALLALPFFGLLPEVIRPVGLFCNLIVSGGAAVIYLRRLQLPFREWWTYVLPGIPMAFVGGWWKLSDEVFFILLAGTLMVASVALWFEPSTAFATEEVKPAGQGRAMKITVGASVGLLSGLVGIGGGIFLSPLMYFFRWSEPRRISAVASLYILFNSAGGLLGQFSRGLPQFEWSSVWPLLVAVLAGGQIGARLGSTRLSAHLIRRVTAAVILAAALLVLKDHWPWR